MAKLVTAQADARASTADLGEIAKQGETVSGFASLWFAERQARDVRIADNERRWYALYWADSIGDIPLAELRTSHVRSVLTNLATGKVRSVRGQILRRASIEQVRGVLSRMLDTAWQDELIDANPVNRVKLKSLARSEVKLPRAILTDEEIRIFLASPVASVEMKMLALVSRTIGGMRAGDLNALTWGAFRNCCRASCSMGVHASCLMAGPRGGWAS